MNAEASVPADVDMSMEVFPARRAPTPDRRAQDDLALKQRCSFCVQLGDASSGILICLILGWTVFPHDQTEPAELEADDDESTHRRAFVNMAFRWGQRGSEVP